jgi:hypothetical protein
MRLAKLKTVNSDPLYINPTSFVSFYEKDPISTIMVFKDDKITITMPLEDVVKEINDALNFIPKYKIDWSDQGNDLIGDFKRGLKP